MLGNSENAEFAAIESADHRIYGVQFHPEVTHTPGGKNCGLFASDIHFLALLLRWA